jgi:hypothetical protein
MGWATARPELELGRVPVPGAIAGPAECDRRPLLGVVEVEGEEAGEVRKRQAPVMQLAEVAEQPNLVRAAPRPSSTTRYATR